MYILQGDWVYDYFYQLNNEKTRKPLGVMDLFI